jgi:hypothetical protein
MRPTRWPAALLRPALLDDRDRRWAEEYGDKVVIRWYTQRPKPMHAAAERLLTDVGKADSTFTHDGCDSPRQHIGNARKSPRLNGRYVLAKPGDGRKIDMAIPRSSRTRRTAT